MNVIGIIQTDLNEFNVLFDSEQQNNQGSQQDQNQSLYQQDQADQNDESMFLSFLGDSGGQKKNQNGGQNGQNGPQEMTVRIKGVPEGQKATFLQMYQIIQDAKETKDLENNLTIVSRRDEQDQNQNQWQNQKQNPQ
ncbi:hypothetical protein [Brevibacillus sp. H7]|uniref:hypothetical protein n=1 Tax=Brevibacillus sp. H7 TaxID=3349138 RepID=UPI003827D089